MTTLSHPTLIVLYITVAVAQNPIANCPTLPAHTPADINDLSPQNINVIMALGDSISAGFGIMGRSGYLNEYRGQSGPIGGDPGAISLANFIQHYNPNVQGASIGEHFVELPTTPHYENDYGNAAQSGATTFDFDDQVDYLINELKSNPNIDLENDWKFLNVLIGANDVCNQCWDFDRPTPKQAALTYAFNLEMTMEKIYENIPRTLVNILPLFNLSGVYNVSLELPYCTDFHDIIPFECNCAFDSDNANRLWLDTSVTLMGQQVFEMVERWQAKNYSTFNLVYQPFTYNIEVADLPLEFLSDLDCFHPSLIAHQVIAINGWNSLIVPFAEKPTKLNLEGQPQCATGNTRFFTT